MDTQSVKGNTNRPNRLKEIALARGMAIEDLIPLTVNEAGSIAGAARVLGVGNTTIRYWLNKMGLKVESRRISSLEHVQS